MRLVLMFCVFVLCGCSRLEYPIVTRYKENRKERYVRVKQPKKHNSKIHIKPIDRDVVIFVVGTIIGYKLFLEE